LPGPVPAGVLRDDLVSSLDIVPTLLSFAGVQPPSDLEGKDLRYGILEEAPVGTSSIVSEHPSSPRAPGGVWVRTPDWRYLRHRDGREELYAIRDDTWEQFDVAAERPDLVSDLRAIHADWRRQFEE
jgi:arylsulfatase A-like enzyme